MLAENPDVGGAESGTKSGLGVFLEASAVDEAAERIVDESRGDEPVVPVGGGSGEARGDFGMRGDEVPGFADVGGKIVELWSVLISAHPLPVSLAHREGLASVHAPKEACVRSGDIFSQEEWQEIHAVESGKLGVARGTGGGEGGGENVERDDGLRVGASGGDTGGPGDEKGDADAAFEDVAFLSAKRGIHGGVGAALGHRPAVIGDEKNERTFALAGRVEGGQDAPHDFVDGGDHRGINAAAFVGDGRKFLKHVLARLERRVRRVECEVEEPRFRVASVACDGGGGFFTEARGEFAHLGDLRRVAQNGGSLLGVRRLVRFLAGADFGN